MSSADLAGGKTPGDPVLVVRGLSVQFKTVRQGRVGSRQKIHAVSDLDLDVHPGESVGLVGESGCGKSTVALAIMQLVAVSSGQVTFAGRELSQLSGRELRRARSGMQMVFQNPGASLDPRMRVGMSVMEPVRVHGRPLEDTRSNAELVASLFEQVGIPRDATGRFPRSFSGGQLQRIAVARALSSRPSLIICDEILSGSDVSLQAQVLNMLSDLRDSFGLAMLFISHDLAVVSHFCSRTIVMYLGRVVETAPSALIAVNPLHPYTQALYSAVPLPDPDIESRRQRIVLEGELPSPMSPPSGCAFHTRCPHATELCKLERPRLLDVSDGRQVACHHWEAVEREWSDAREALAGPA